MREAGLMPIVLPATDDSDGAGIAVFTASPEEVREIMDADPGVVAGIFGYEMHPVRGFPGFVTSRVGRMGRSGPTDPLRQWAGDLEPAEL